VSGAGTTQLRFRRVTPGALAASLVRRARTLPERHGGPVVLALVCAVIAVGFGLRVDFAKNHIDRPTPDSLGYGRIAESLYEKQRFGQRGDFGGEEVQEPTNYSPGLPLFIAGVYYATGGVNPLAGRMAIVIVATLAILFAYLIGRRLAGPIAGLIATVPVAIYPALLEYQGMFMSECLAVGTLSGAVLAFLWTGDRVRAGGSLWWWAFPGALFGATALIRPEYLVFGVIFAVLAFVRVARDRGGWRPGLRGGALVAATFCLFVVPWTVRNYIVLDRLVPLSTGGGKALFIGTYLPADGVNDRTKFELLERRTQLRRSILTAYPRYRPSQIDDRMYFSQRNLPLDGVDPHILVSQRLVTGEYIYLDQILKSIAARRYPGVSTDEALAKMGKSNLVHDVTEHPLDYADMLLYKGWRMWRNGPRNTMLEPGWIVMHGAMAALGLIALVMLAWRRRWEALVLGSLIVGVTALGMVLLPSERRVLVLVPLVAALAGAGAVMVFGQARALLGSRRRTPRMPGGGTPRSAEAGGA
jgi:MFS family permease